MANKFSYTTLTVLGIALAGGGAWWLQSRPTAATPVTGSSGSVESNTAAGKAGASSGTAAPRLAGVEVAKVEAVALRDDVQAVGSLRARQSVMLRPELVGRITALNFKDGGSVRKGQILVQFDDQLQQAELQQMQAQLAIAQANFKRTQELVAQNFMAQQTLDTSAANLKVAQAQLGLAQAVALGQGTLTAVMLKPTGPLAMLGLLLRGSVGTLGGANAVESFEFHRLQVSPRLPWGRHHIRVAYDGEVSRLRAPLVFQVSPQPLYLIKP